MGLCASIGMVPGISNEDFEERIASAREVLERTSTYTIESDVRIYAGHVILNALVAGLETYVTILNQGKHPTRTEWWTQRSIDFFDERVATITAECDRLNKLLLQVSD